MSGSFSYIDASVTYLVMAVSVVVFMAGMAFVFVRFLAPDSKGHPHQVPSLILVGVVSLLTAMAVAIATGSATAMVLSVPLQEERQTWAENAYGIQLSSTQYKELDFPLYEPPNTNWEAYGATTVTRNEQVIDIQLVWQDGQYVLLDVHGHPLPTR